MTSVDSNFKFLCGRPHGTGPPVHLSLTPSPPCGRHKWMAPKQCLLLNEYVHKGGVSHMLTREKESDVFYARLVYVWFHSFYLSISFCRLFIFNWVTMVC